MPHGHIIQIKKQIKKILVLTLDAFGDFINYSVFQFKNHNSIKRITKGGNSIIARLYRYTTLLLGFKPDNFRI